VGRSFGQTPDGIALTMFAAGQAFSLGRWLLVAVVVGRTLLVGPLCRRRRRRCSSTAA
jgi:hypothetical protein